MLRNACMALFVMGCVSIGNVNAASLFEDPNELWPEELGPRELWMVKLKKIRVSGFAEPVGDLELVAELFYDEFLPFMGEVPLVKEPVIIDALRGRTVTVPEFVVPPLVGTSESFQMSSDGEGAGADRNLLVYLRLFEKSTGLVERYRDIVTQAVRVPVNDEIGEDPEEVVLNFKTNKWKSSFRFPVRTQITFEVSRHEKLSDGLLLFWDNRPCGESGTIEERIEDCDYVYANGNFAVVSRIPGSGSRLFRVVQDLSTGLLWSDRNISTNHYYAAMGLRWDADSMQARGGLEREQVDWDLPSVDEIQDALKRGLNEIYPKMILDLHWTRDSVNDSDFVYWAVDGRQKDKVSARYDQSLPSHFVGKPVR